MKTTIGKTKIEIEVRGCVECGTEWSFNWQVDREIKVTIGKREGIISLHICGDCLNMREKTTCQPSLMKEVS